jgi:hypothetical protein
MGDPKKGKRVTSWDDYARSVLVAYTGQDTPRAAALYLATADRDGELLVKMIAHSTESFATSLITSMTESITNSIERKIP